MRGLLAAAALLTALAGPAAAQAPNRTTVHMDVSPAGQAVIKKWMTGRDPQIEASVKQLRDVATQLRAMPNQPKVDLARMTALMRRQEALEAAIRTRSNNRTLGMLRELPEGDRIKFLRGIAKAGQQAQQKPAGGR